METFDGVGTDVAAPAACSCMWKCEGNCYDTPSYNYYWQGYKAQQQP